MGAAARKIYNLTQSQLTLWASQKLHHEVPLHNVAHTFEISGAIDRGIFQAAFQLLLDTTDVLRTVFSEKDGIPNQSFLEQYKYELEFVDFTNDSNKILVNDWIKNQTKKSFDLKKRNFTTALLKIGENKFIWFLNLHHLITDGFTTAMLYERMSSIYEALSNGESYNDDIAVPYEQYLTFLNEQRQNDADKTNRVYWKEKIANSIEKPRLYGASDQNNNTLSQRVKIKLGKELSEQLKELAKHQDIKGWTQDSTLFNILATVYLIYLHRVSGEKKLSIGTSAHNRASKKFRKTPGLFIEVFPLVGKLFEDDTFLSVYKRVKSEVDSFLKNVKPGVFEAGFMNSSNVLLNYILTRFSDFNGFSTSSEWIHTGHMNSAHLMELHVVDYDNEGEIELLFDINASLRNSEERKTLPYHFLELLNALVQNREQSIYAASLLSKSEFKNNLSYGEKTTDEFKSILELFESQSANSPKNIAVTFDGFTLSYGDLNKRINQLANYLISRNVGKGSQVAILLKRSPEFVISLMAILKTGACYVPIPFNYPNQRVQYLLDDSRADHLISNEAISKNKLVTNTTIIKIDTLDPVLKEFPTSNPSVYISPTNIAFLIYTSGSTGKPKGVKISHSSLANYIKWTEHEYISVEFPAIPLFTSVGFDITANSVFLPLICGGCIHVYQETDLYSDLSILNVVDDNKVDFIKLTPAHLSFLTGKKYPKSKIKVMVVTGDEFKINLAQEIRSAFHKELKIYNEYGPAEATIGCTFHEYQHHYSSTSVPIGLPIHNMNVFLLDQHRNPIPRGVVGEIYLSGTGLADGYWEKPEITKQKFIANPFESGTKMYRTQDLARYDENGLLVYLGRTDFQVKIDGHRIELGEIEAQLESFKGVEGSVVLMNERNGLKSLTAYLTSKASIDLSELKSHLAKSLPRYMIPTFYKVLKEFPLSPNGKVNRKMLKTYNANAIDSKLEYIPPQTEIEKVVAKIWQEILEVSQIGINDNFIALGGHSLAAIRVTARINQEIEMNFPLNKIFELPTIKKYSKYIEETLISLMGE